MEKALGDFKKYATEVFATVSKSVAKQIGEMLNKVDASEIERILEQIDLSGLVVLADDYQEVYEELAKDGAAVALAQIGVSDERMVTLVNEKAVEWAKARAAEMVGKKLLADGSLIDNPNAQWVITDATREILNSFVAEAIESGWSNETLADKIQETYAFSDDRAEMIARTETAFSDVQGNMIAYRESGLVDKKQWLASDDCCDDCEAIDGKIVDIDDEFVDGVDEPPYHPNCRCDVLPVLADETNTESDGE